MFSKCKKVKLGSLIKQIRGVSYKPKDLSKELDEDHITLLRANNISNNEIVLDDVQYVSRKNVTNNQHIKFGDILMCASSGSKEHVGKTAFCELNGEYTFGAFCKLVRPIDLKNSFYIAAYFNSNEYRRYISDISRGANINNIKNEHIDDIEIPLPKNEEIIEFTNFVKHLDKSKFAIEESIKSVLKLKYAKKEYLCKTILKSRQK